MAVTDGSYIRELIPKVCYAAFVLECSEEKGRITGSFPEQSNNANAYRAKIPGLIAIHLILFAANSVRPYLTRAVRVVSDYLGALGKVSTLSWNRIPCQCQHSDILKTIMVNCGKLGFALQYLHVRAHQDDLLAYHLLSRLAQLNCLMDMGESESSGA